MRGNLLLRFLFLVVFDSKILGDFGAAMVFNRAIGFVAECPPMVRETGVQSQVESYQRLKKWYLIPPCLTPSIIRYVSRIKWSNPGKRVVQSPTPRCSSYWKGSLQVTLDYGCQLYFYLWYMLRRRLMYFWAHS